MTGDKNHIDAKQIMTFIVSAQIGLGLLILPTDLARDVGHDGWISVLLGSLAISLIIFIIKLFMERYHDKSLLDITRLLYGRYLGTFLNLLILIYLFLGSIIGLRLFTDVIKITVLELTPSLILATFIFIPYIYLCWFGLKAICRFGNILIAIAVSVIFLLILLIPKMKFTFLLPVGDIGLLPIIKGTFSTIPLFIGIELIPIIYSEVKDKKYVFKYLLRGHIFTTIFSLIVVICSIALYGEEMLKRMDFSLFQIFRVYTSSLFERVDLFFDAIWFPAMGISLLTYYFSAFYSINKILKIQKKGITFALLTSTVIILSRIPKDFEATLKALNTFGLLGIIFLLFIVISYILSYINKRGVSRR